MPADVQPVLTRPRLAEATRVLTRRDPRLRAIVRRVGPPPLRFTRPGFATLVRIIVEQQVSLASAAAVMERLRSQADPLTPERVLALTARQLRAAGLSRQKVLYVRDLAGRVADGRLQPAALRRLDDDEARRALMQVKGVGAWSADVYLLGALRRRDVWPAGDLALAVAVQEACGLDERPGPRRMHEVAERWRPWRAVAARILWSDYRAKYKRG